jgi:hypothetical protein
MTAWAVWMDACEDAGICTGEHAVHYCMQARRVFREPMRAQMRRVLARRGWPPASRPVRRAPFDSADYWCPDPHEDPGAHRLVEHRWCQPLPGSEQWERGW